MTSVQQLAETRDAGPYLMADRARFANEFDARPFEFMHRLAQHPLFEPDRLLMLAAELAADPRDVYYDAGEPEIGQRWDELAVCDIPIADLLRRIESANAWIVLRRAEKNPEYAALLERCFAEILELSGRDLSKVVKLTNAIVFINSPHRVSTYHIDRECNFLLQIRGSKTVHVFDRNDREVLPEAEVERFWTVDNNAATYKSDLAGRARVFALSEGGAVHIPVNAPHWVKNGPRVSVSLSINFHYHDRVLADVYRANYWLRRVGLRPTPPRRSAVVDRLKSTLYGSTRALHGAVRRAGVKP